MTEDEKKRIELYEKRKKEYPEYYKILEAEHRAERPIRILAGVFLFLVIFFVFWAVLGKNGIL